MIHLNSVFTILLLCLSLRQAHERVLSRRENCGRNKVVISRIPLKNDVFCSHLTLPSSEAMREQLPTFLCNWHEFRYAFDAVAHCIDVINACPLCFTLAADHFA